MNIQGSRIDKNTKELITLTLGPRNSTLTAGCAETCCTFSQLFIERKSRLVKLQVCVCVWYERIAIRGTQTPYILVIYMK